jgi:hypothetical protein
MAKAERWKAGGEVRRRGRLGEESMVLSAEMRGGGRVVLLVLRPTKMCRPGGSDHRGR